MGLVKGYSIIKEEDIIDELIDYRVTYADKGKYLGFHCLADIYSMQSGNVTDWTGYPMSGKTQVLMELLLNLSLFYGWKHLVYFPDVGNAKEIISDLLHKVTGKTFNPKYGNHISELEIYQQTQWILEHFKVLTKSDVKATMTPFQFWDFAVHLKKTQGLNTASIDSWKDMYHDYNKYGNYATYLEKVLPYRNQVAEDNDLHLHTIIHPKLTEKKDGKLSPPQPNDLKGGSEWWNSGKNMVTVHRETKDTNEVKLIFGKIKPRSVGNVGIASLFFDLELFRYYELVDGAGQGERRYAQNKEENNMTNIDENKTIDFNHNF